MYDSNPMHTSKSNKIVVKHISVTHSESLTLNLKSRSYLKTEDNNLGNKNILPLNKLSRDSLSKSCANDELNRLRITYLR